MSTGLLRRHREALSKLRAEEAAQEIVEPVLGTYACPICDVETPHHHPATEVSSEPTPEPTATVAVSKTKRAKGTTQTEE